MTPYAARQVRGLRPLAGLAIGFFLFLLFLWAGAARACPACGDALSSKADPAAAKLTQGWGHSIALLMGAPYLLFAGTAFCIVRSARRHRGSRPPQ